MYKKHFSTLFVWNTVKRAEHCVEQMEQFRSFRSFRSVPGFSTTPFLISSFSIPGFRPTLIERAFEANY